MKKSVIIFGLLAVLMAVSISAQMQYCKFNNQGVNCNMVNAGETFCYYAMGTVVNVPASLVSCDSTAIVCAMDCMYNNIKCAGPAGSVPDRSSCSAGGIGTFTPPQFDIGLINAGGAVFPPKSYRQAVVAIDLVNAEIETRDYPELPSGLGSLFSNDVVDVVIKTRDNKEEHLGVIVKNKHLMEVKSATPLNPTIRVTGKEEIVDAILQADDKLAALEYAFNEDLIEYQGVTFAAKMKIGVIKTFVSVISFFTGRGTTDYDLNVPPAPNLPAPTPVITAVGFEDSCSADVDCSLDRCAGGVCRCYEGLCKLKPGQECVHQGECAAPYCIGQPSDQGIKFFCSCKETSHEYYSC